MEKHMERLPFPAKVFRGPGALKQVGDFCRTQGKNAFILGGKTALLKTEEQLAASLTEAGVKVVATEWYGGECTMENIDHLAGAAAAQKADFIIAVGGGKALDTGKAVAAKSKLPVITVPTIAATCAAATPLTVLYNNKGEFTSNLFLADCPAAIVIDTAIILATPVSWLIAGMGDTLAKMYELRAAASCMTPTSLTISAVMNGQICYDIIKRFGGEARQAVESQTLCGAFDSIVDAIILAAGISSIFGGDKLRNAAAHAIYNGFTKIPATHAVAHGSIVGYGNLCLLALEGRADAEIIEEITLAQSCGIPTTLKQIADLSDDEMRLGAEASCKAAAMSCMPFPVTAQMVLDAIRRVDALAAR
ncbi:iron-containing alcohol dehydrogenase family protein [Sporomusa sphaeroides DSM 2875]|uniref:iron-containing alcohol dehydrogenase family protein n=1 Tax=Sporomusa sphaeroides TaxID=47679 RepID=UPI002030BF30|nr:iron-containing alcohol dehydrogenase family protein [Sporomusa sphaeroides]MCM0758937.1 iron-containing alcohol dehydrogenase family protein [Sporomusa sphaeroides DSM 2875]